MANETTASSARSLRGLRIVVTGGTAGLGRALVHELTARGATVGFVARGRERVEALAREVPSAIGVVGDVSSKDDVHPIAIQLAGRLGGVDVLIHNASSLGTASGGTGPLAMLADTECEDLEHALATNVLGPFRLTKALLGGLVASAQRGVGGLVLAISSDAAVTPYPGWGSYGASKAALAHLMAIWDNELSRQGVRFVPHDPGDMDTALHAQALPDADRASLKRPETSAKEIADLVAERLHPDRLDPARASTPTHAEASS
jgi:NAD(P)-dependent dehydrogenase (short-subunit alcohol dehydrogenase family)